MNDKSRSSLTSLPIVGLLVLALVGVTIVALQSRASDSSESQSATPTSVIDQGDSEVEVPVSSSAEGDDSGATKDDAEETDVPGGADEDTESAEDNAEDTGSIEVVEEEPSLVYVMSRDGQLSLIEDGTTTVIGHSGVPSPSQLDIQGSMILVSGDASACGGTIEALDTSMPGAEPIDLGIGSSAVWIDDGEFAYVDESGCDGAPDVVGFRRVDGAPANTSIDLNSDADGLDFQADGLTVGPSGRLAVLASQYDGESLVSSSIASFDVSATTPVFASQVLAPLGSLWPSISPDPAGYVVSEVHDDGSTSAVLVEGAPEHEQHVLFESANPVFYVARDLAGAITYVGVQRDETLDALAIDGADNCDVYLADVVAITLVRDGSDLALPAVEADSSEPDVISISDCES